MTKLLLGAAAAVLYAGNAFAGTSVISLDGFCDTYTLQTQEAKKIIAVSSNGTGCDDNAGIGAVAKVKGSGAFAVMGSHYVGFGDEVTKIKLSYPIVTGGSWELDNSTDGVNFTFCCSGTYSVVGAGKHDNKGKPPAMSLAIRH